jgi:O-antigen ligase
MDTGSPSALARLPTILLLILPVIVLHYFAIANLYDPGLHPKYFFLAIYLILLGLIPLFRTRDNNQLAQKVALHRIPAWWAALALPLVMTASLLWARTPMEGLPAVARLWEWFLLLSLLVITFSGSAEFHRWLPRLATVFVLVTGLAALGQLAWVVWQQGYSHESSYWVLVSFAHRNLLSHALALAMPLVLLSFLRDRGAWWGLAIGAMGLGVAVLLLLLVRASWVAVGASGIVFGAMWLLFWGRMKVEMRGRAGKRLALLFGIGLVALLAGWMAFRPALQGERILEKQGAGIVGTTYGSPGERSLFWKRTLDLWKQKPLTGHGAGSWKIEAPGSEIGGSRKAIGRGEVFVVRTHNDWLQLLSEGGPLALLAFLLMPVLVVWRGISPRRGGQYARRGVLQYAQTRGFTNAEEDREDGLSLSSSTKYDQSRGMVNLQILCYSQGLVIFLVIAFFSFPLERPSSYVWWSIYPAAILLTGSLPMQKSKEGPGKWSGTIVWLVGAITLALLGGIWMRQDARWLQAMEAGAHKNPRQVVVQIDEELMSWLPLAPATTPLAWYRGMAYLELGDTTAALSDFERAYQAHPRHPHVLNNLATLLNQKGQIEVPRSYLQTAVSIAPLLEDARLNLAALEFNAGRVDTAYQHLCLIPIASTNAKYPVFRDVITAAMMDLILSRHREEAVYPEIKGMRNNTIWMKNLHEKAIVNHLSLEHQVLLDAIYILKKDRKGVSSIEIQRLYNHFRLDSIN